MNVLGIDPGTASTGYGVIRIEGSRMRALEHGVVTTPASAPPAERLATIYRRICELIAVHEPAAAALEDLYVGANPRTVLAVGQGRGAVLAACGVAALPAESYPPAEVKSAVCGFGRADKLQVQRMVGAMLGIDATAIADHASDALAVAICHGVRSRSPLLDRAAAR